MMCRPTGPVLLTEAYRNRHARQSSQVNSSGVGIGQVHLPGSSGTALQIKRNSRRSRLHDDVALLERLCKIMRNEAAQLLCLDIVRVVITVR